MSDVAREARLWAQKWRWYERSSLPWNRARIHWEFLRREAFVRWPVHGNVLEALRERLPEYRIAVEFRSPRWLAEQRDRERTLSMLEEHGLVFVCVDAPKVSGLPRLLAVTNPELFVMRFHGRSDSTWSDTSRSAAERFRYLYSREELEELARPIAEHLTEARESHLLMNNCYRDYSVRNAAELRDLLARYAGG